MKKSAFTLIELLVVISIIAILAGIALPVFNKVQERSKATNDASNLRQIGIGLVAYLSDNDDQMFTAAGGANANSWPVTLQSKYVPSWKVFRSPFDKVTAARPDKSVAPNVPVSYGINTNCLTPADPRYRNVGSYKAPSQLILMAPAMQPGAPEPTFTGTSESNPSLPLPAGGATKEGTHSNRSQINVLYADSHVSSVLYTQYALTSTPEGKLQWNPAGQ